MRIGFIDTSSREAVLKSCHSYLRERRSCYEFRAIRYESVYSLLIQLGFHNGSTLTDIGAGDGEFHRFLLEHGFHGRYLPVDGLIDGTDLNCWEPSEEADFMVSIEVIEHLRSPRRLLHLMERFSNKGAVVTTPNPAVVNVYAMDATHISAVRAEEFYRCGWKVVPQIFFVESEDSLLGWISKNQTLGI